MARAPRTARTPRKPRRQTEQARLQEIFDSEASAPAQEHPELLALLTERAQSEVDIATLRQQVETCRNMFFRLATVRAADMVVHQGKGWDDGAAYINAEMQGLDQALRSVADGNGAQP